MTRLLSRMRMTRLSMAVVRYSVSERAWPHLDVSDVALVSFGEPGHVGTVRSPYSAALPASVRIVDAPIQTACVERHWIRHANHRERFFLRIEDDHRIRRRPRYKHRVLAESKRVELIDPKEIWILGASSVTPRTLE